MAKYQVGVSVRSSVAVEIEAVDYRDACRKAVEAAKANKHVIRRGGTDYAPTAVAKIA
ncbi:hypothetical protein ACFVGM_09265 [Kitasatospora purpeofusca]|uniref:hypothetical protein n=1 Tax=Kitasatospora purpeofusca TaxID=67352 RepID=UPI003681FA00